MSGTRKDSRDVKGGRGKGTTERPRNIKRLRAEMGGQPPEIEMVKETTVPPTPIKAKVSAPTTTTKTPVLLLAAKPTPRPTAPSRPGPGSASTQRLIFAQPDDWKGAAEFYSTMTHTSFSEVLEKGGLVDIIGDFVPGEIIRVEVIPARLVAGFAEPRIHFDSGYKVKGQLPDDWLPLSQTPAWFQKRWGIRVEVVNALGGDITPWSDGIATKTLLGALEEETRIRMYFQILRHKMTDGRTIQAPFGISILLKPTEKTAVYEDVYDPEKKFGVRAGQMVSLGRLTQSSLDPVPHLFKAWAKMESNCPGIQKLLQKHQRSTEPPDATTSTKK